MRELKHLSRRRFVLGLGPGAVMALAGGPRAPRARQAEREAEVRISRFAFHPRSLEVLAGDAVIWVNDDLAPHTATAADGTWDTGALDRHDRGRVVFDRPGRHAYFCAFHPRMTGTVIVRARTGG